MHSGSLLNRPATVPCLSANTHVPLKSKDKSALKIRCDQTAIACREAAETMALLEAIMEGLTDSHSGALRDLCAAATAEFLVWSAKHIPASKEPARGSSNENLNAASLLRRLYERMAHPEAYQRSEMAPTPPCS